jgi:hypothetical protein
MCCADSLEIKMMRPQFFSSMPGRYARLSRTPLITFTSKKRSPIGVGDLEVRFTSKIHRLLTRMSVLGGHLFEQRLDARSRAKIRSNAGEFRATVRWPNVSRALSTRACVRLLITTRAPASESVAPIAYPIPAVEPVTFPCSPRFIWFLPCS